MKVNKNKLEIEMARSKLNLTDLAEKTNMPLSSVSNLLRRGACKPATLGKVADALNVDVTELLEEGF